MENSVIESQENTEKKDIAIGVYNIGKMYKLYANPKDRFKESLGFTKKKCYQEKYALNNVSFEVKKGETVGIIGTNGSGKSTILKIITGVLNPTEGELTINGRISALLELGAGFNMEYPGIENIYLNGAMIGYSKEEIDARLDDILKFADIGDYIYQPVKTYSSGMFVRLAFAVAINIDPEILIVDEALSVGDVFFQAKCYRKFEEFKKMGKTILFVSHDLGSVNKYCDRVVLLNNGVKLKEGKPAEIIDIYKKLLVNQMDDNNAFIKTDESTGEIEDKREKGELGRPWKTCYTINPNVQEYGNRRAEIIDFAIMDDKGTYTNILSKEKEFTIKVKVKFHEKVDNPIFAYTIKNLRGTDITGTNTMYEKVYIEEPQIGDERTAIFTQNLNLQGGEYLISLGCTGYNGEDFEVYHRLYDVCTITVISEKNTVGFYDMCSKVTIE